MVFKYAFGFRLSGNFRPCTSASQAHTLRPGCHKAPLIFYPNDTYPAHPHDLHLVQTVGGHPSNRGIHLHLTKCSRDVRLTNHIGEDQPDCASASQLPPTGIFSKPLASVTKRSRKGAPSPREHTRSLERRILISWKDRQVHDPGQYYRIR